MQPDAAPNPQADVQQLETATDQAIAACGGNARAAVTALIVANQFLEAQIEELQADVSKGYARGYPFVGSSRHLPYQRRQLQRRECERRDRHRHVESAATITAINSSYEKSLISCSNLRASSSRS